MERLDRFLVSIEYLSSFTVGYAKILNTSASNHYPITLILEAHCPLGPIPFKYSPLWNWIPAVGDIVQKTWIHHVEGSPGFIWETKLKRVKQVIKEWAKENYQDPEKVKKKIKSELESVQIRIEEHGLTQQTKEQEYVLYAQLSHINREEEIKWRLKSRQLWLQEGDKNTTYFHKRATARKLRNNVSTILDNEGNLHNTQESIRKAASKHYRDLLSETKGEEDYSDFLQHLPKVITKEMNDNLNKEIEEEEIKRAIWNLHPDKAPGPDGFPICFYRRFWNLIKKDLVKMIRWAQRKRKIGGYTNATFLALIPKENRPSSLSRFRPISLCNSSYKILTKILATRLKPLLSSLISENQGGFLPNRQITNSILLVQEAIHSSLSRKEKGFVLKLDLENAFDRVRHSFLIVVLKKTGFETPFINLIVACISSPWISPLINGRPGEAFQSSRGLRQGCPLSPYLFILMAESFSRVLDHNQRLGLITGIKFGNGAKSINHSQFADDTLLIGGASTTITRLSTALQIYLASPAIWTRPTSPLKVGTWNEIIDKVKRKVPQWGSLWLNPAGRLILLKSGPSSWWKRVLETKYLNSPRQQLFESNIPNKDSSKIWRLCKKVLPLMIQNISKVPSGGDSISIGTDRIMGQQPINMYQEAMPIIEFLNNRGIHHLAQISSWDPFSHIWTGWTFPEIPSKLKPNLSYLQTLLQNKAPIKKNESDGYHWDSTGTSYTVKPGHQLLCNSTFPMNLWNQWKIVWRSEALPKIIFFIWLLLKGKILTAENLKKRGINGPSRCPNCCKAEETMHHLFVEYPFAIDCWQRLSTTGSLAWNSQQSIADTIHIWRNCCPWKEKRSNMVRRVWNTLPYTLLWRIWLARN
eukprot:PITA_27333